MNGPAERTIRTESVRIPRIRDTYGSCHALGASIRDEGLRRPITVWSDGTLISGGRRLFASLLMDKPRIQAVFVDTIEDAAKCLQRDNEDDTLALPFKSADLCRLWELLRRLDGPAALVRAEQARRRGAQLRRQTRDGKRKPGRSANRTEDYALNVISAPFGISGSTANRLLAIYNVANGRTDITDEKREQAAKALAAIDAGESSIWANYQLITGARSAPVAVPRPAEPIPSAPAARQITAWNRSLPQMEGLVAGLAELGAPNAELTWNEVGPVHARLMAVRRDMEKIIKKMRETTQS